MTALTTAETFELGKLPPEVRDEVDLWLKAVEKVVKPVMQSFHRIAQEMQCSWKTVSRNYYNWQNGCTKGDRVFEPGDWRMFVNYSKVPEKESVLTPEFLDWFKALAESNQRNGNKWAHRQFCSRWKDGQHIPGLDNSLSRRSIPPGTGYDNINKKIQDEFGKLSMRRGLGVAIAKCGPKIFTTRANLWPMSHTPIDDLWHDNYVVFSGKSGARAQIVRTLELDGMDVFTGKLLAFGTKPRIRREDGVMDGLREKYASLLLCNIYFNTGYSPRGTTIMAEHGTGAVPERVARILYDRTGGLIQLRESGMTGEEQVICGYRGKAKGNPRFKAALECIRSLKHNELASVPGQTGKDREHAPEYTGVMVDGKATHGQLKQCEDLLKAMFMLAKMHPERARALKLNLLDYHAHFLPLLIGVYQEINDRTWHELEGWHRIPGNVQIDYRTTPTTDHWLSDEEFSNLPVVARDILLAAAEQDRRYIQTRRLSPSQAFELHGRNAGLLKLPPFVVGEILAGDDWDNDFAYEKRVEGAYFELIENMEIDPEPMRFESVITTPDGRREQLADGKYLELLNPFDPKQLFVFDSRKVCLGIAQRVERVDQTDIKQLTRAFGNRERRLKELTAPILQRHAATVREETKRAEHNARVLDLNKPFTQEEINLSRATEEAAKEISGSSDSTSDLLAML